MEKLWPVYDFATEFLELIVYLYFNNKINGLYVLFLQQSKKQYYSFTKVSYCQCFSTLISVDFLKELNVNPLRFKIFNPIQKADNIETDIYNETLTLSLNGPIEHDLIILESTFELMINVIVQCISLYSFIKLTFIYPMWLLLCVTKQLQYKVFKVVSGCSCVVKHKVFFC